MLYENHLNQWSKCPMHLQHKVWFDILYYMGRLGQEGMHKFTKEAFAVKKNAEGRKYVYQTFNDVTKKSQGDDTSVSRSTKIDMDHIMFELPGDKKSCPITSFEFYLTKLNADYDYLWQHPNLFCKYPQKDRWYDKQKIGEKSMHKWMKELSIAACLSEKYTNHCVRKTCTTALAKSGFTPHEIANITAWRALKRTLRTPP